MVDGGKLIKLESLKAVYDKQAAIDGLIFNSSKSYSTGEYAIYNGCLYYFTTDHTGAWDNNDAVIVNLADEIYSIKNDLDERISVLEAAALGGEMSLEEFNQCVVLGIGPRVAPVGTSLIINKANEITTTIGSRSDGNTGITNVTVDMGAFLERIGTSNTNTYEFIYDGTYWLLDEEAINLNHYGITLEGTPLLNDTFTVDVSGQQMPMTVLDYDYHTPVDSNIQHTCTIGLTSLARVCRYDMPEAFIKVVDGLEEGSHFYITLDHGAFDGNTSQDGVYGGTLGEGQTIPPGGYIRHETIGEFQYSYNKQQILNGKWIIYDTNFNTIGNKIITDTDDTTGKNFGIATSKTYGGNSEHVNFTSRQRYGSNNISQSFLLQYANAEQVSNWWQQKNEWDFPPTASNDWTKDLKGFLSVIDQSVKQMLVKVRIRVEVPEYDGTQGFEDVETYVFPLSQIEAGIANIENNNLETSYGLNETIKNTPLAYYDGSSNIDRIKTYYQDDSPIFWYLRGVLSNPDRCKVIQPDGNLGTGTTPASNACGFVPTLVIGKPIVRNEGNS